MYNCIFLSNSLSEILCFTDFNLHLRIQTQLMLSEEKINAEAFFTTLLFVLDDEEIV